MKQHLTTTIVLVFLAALAGLIIFHGFIVVSVVRSRLIQKALQNELTFDAAALLLALIFLGMIITIRRILRRFALFSEQRLAWWAKQLEPKDLLTLENALRANRIQVISTAAQIIGGTVLLIGIYFTWANLAATQEGQITDRFIRAVDQLGTRDKDGKPVREIRLGGIYGLRRIAQASPRDYKPVMEILNDYVRLNAPWPMKSTVEKDGHGQATASAGIPEVQPETDIQAALNFLGERVLQYEESTPVVLNLPRTDLRGATLVRAHLVGAHLEGAHLENANLIGADLGKANLTGAHLEKALFYFAHLEGALLLEADLENAGLIGAHLERAILIQADLKGAILLSADLKGAHVNGADLKGADLREAAVEYTDLSEARNLTQEQVNSAHGGKETKLPPGMVRPESWKASKPEIGPGADLTRASMEGIHLEGRHLERAHMNGAHLDAAYFKGAHLVEADLQGADLKGADLEEADLEGANLERAHMNGGYLNGEYLNGANLNGSNLKGAHLEYTDLSEVRNLTQEQVASAHGNEETKLPPAFVKPKSWSQTFR